MRAPYDPPHETARFSAARRGDDAFSGDCWFSCLRVTSGKQKISPGFLLLKMDLFFLLWRMERAYSAAAALSFVAKTEREDFLLKQRERST